MVDLPLHISRDFQQNTATVTGCLCRDQLQEHALQTSNVFLNDLQCARGYKNANLKGGKTIFA